MILFDEYAHEMYGKLLYIFHYSHAERAVLVGDALQIPVFSYLPLVHYEHQRCELEPHRTLSTTYRCPADVRALMSKFYRRTVTGPNGRTNTLRAEISDPRKQLDGAVRIAFT